MRKELGFLNHRLYTDVKSHKVFEENGKMFAIEVEKIRACDPEFIVGGFAGHCTNQDEVWGGYEVKEIGEPFEITFSKRHNAWGYNAPVVLTGTVFESKASLEKYVESVSDWYANNKKCRLVVNFESLSVCVIELTKTGKDRKHFVNLGTKIDDQCRYFYDYNF